MCIKKTQEIGKKDWGEREREKNKTRLFQMICFEKGERGVEQVCKFLGVNPVGTLKGIAGSFASAPD